MYTKRRPAGVFLAALMVVAGCRSASAAAYRPAPAPDDLQAGIQLYQEGKFAEAESALRKASGTEASAYLAASLAKQKKHAEAEATAKGVLEADPTHALAVAALGESLVGQKKHDEAIARMTAAIKAKDDLAYAFYWRGHAYYGKKQHAHMVEDFETFLRLAPKAPEASLVNQLLSTLR